MNDAESLPREVLIGAADGVAEREKQVISTSAQLSETLGRLKEECRREIRARIGAAGLETYERFHERSKQRIADLPGSTRHTTESLKLDAQLRRQILMEARQFVSQSRIDVRGIEAIQKKYKAEARSAVESAMQATDEAPYVEINPIDLPTPAHNPWEWRSPPYAGRWGTQSSYGTRGTRSVTHAESQATGEIGCWSNMNISGADDSDTTYTNAYSEVQFWFQMPAAGLVEVWLYLQAIDTPYGGCLNDEWGVSGASIHELSRPYLWITSPYSDPRYGTLLDYRRGEDDGCWSGVIASAGVFNYAHLFSLSSYAVGQWVYCGVGIHDYNWFWVNDMSCHTNMTSRWFVKNVAVRSTGAP